MLIYNKLTELVGSNFVVIVLFDVAILLVTFFIFKKKPKTPILVFSLVTAILLSLLSLVVGGGAYSGTQYFERFGWPFQYYFVTRSIEVGTSIAVPFAYRFDFLRFLINVIVWSLVPFILLTALFNKEKNSYLRLLSFSLLSIVLFIVILLGLSYTNSVSKQHKVSTTSSTKIVPPTTHNTANTKKRDVIETQYPELKNFENQQSFAGRSVEILNENELYYIAYIEHGSGVKYIKATCFKVDENNKVYKTGEFPQNESQRSETSRINPKLCK